MAQCFIYNMLLPLTYNSASVYSIKKDSEYVMGLDKVLEWDGENVCEISAEVPKIAYRLENVYPKNAECPQECDLMNEYLFSAEGIIAVGEETAITLLREKASKVCEALSLMLAKHNVNKQSYHPRVQPDWSRLSVSEKLFQPEPLEESYVDENGNIVFTVRADLRIKAEIYTKIFGRLPTDEFMEYLNPSNPQFAYVMEEYCAALGNEGTQSKYYHLFCIIEFIERELSYLSVAKRVVSDEQIKDCCDYLTKNLSLDKKTKETVISGVKDRLMKFTEDGRAQTIVNILQAMDITEIRDGGNKFVMDKNFMKKHIEARNHLFHGNKIQRGLSERVSELMCLDFKILEYLKNRE